MLISLALFMTFFVMAPTFDRAWQNGLKPMLDNEISQQDALAAVSEPFREFMLSQVREKDIALFESLSKGRFDAGERSKVDFRLLIPAYMISELRRGFEIGFLVVLPFLVIDMIVATLTMSMGMMMLPPSVISLPGQDPVLRAGGRLEPACRQPRPLHDLRAPASRKPRGFKWTGTPRSLHVAFSTPASPACPPTRTGCRRSPRMSRTPTRPATRTSRPTFRPWSTRSPTGTAEGAGVQTSSVSLNALQGSVVSTQTATNLAVQGSGFFVVSDSAGNLYLTRNGSFVPDASGNLVNSAGYYLMADNVQNGQVRSLVQFSEQPAEGQRRQAPA